MPCAQASVIGGDSDQGQAYVLGGATVTLDGSYSSATATLAPGVVQSAYRGTVFVDPTGTATIVEATQLEITVRPGATATVNAATSIRGAVQTGAVVTATVSEDIQLNVQGGTLALTALAGPGYKAVFVSEEGSLTAAGDKLRVDVDGAGSAVVDGTGIECNVFCECPASGAHCTIGRWYTPP